MPKSDSKSKSKPKSSATAKAGLKVKPVKDLEPDETQSEDVRGGQGGIGVVGGAGGNGGEASSPMPPSRAGLCHSRGAVAKLRELRF